MNAKLLAVGALVTALLATGATLGSTSATAASTTKIMLAGDSITQGRDGDYTWRYRFAMELKKQQVTNVDLVGPSRFPRSYGSRYPHYLATGWDVDHDATSGTTLAYQVELIRGQVAAYKPDVLVSYLGTNDFLQVRYAHPNLSTAALMPYYKNEIDTTLSNWETYISNARAGNKNVKIVLGELVSPNIPQSILNEYNSRLATLISQTLSNPNSPIEIAQLAGSLWSSTHYLYDGVHPTPTAETFLAQAFSDTIAHITRTLTAKYGIFRIDPAHRIFQSNVAWNPPLTAKAKVKGGHISLNWAFAFTYNSATAMRARVTAVRNGRVQVTPFRTTSTWTSKTLAPGKYRVRLQAARAGMESTWGQVYTITVPKPRS